MGPSIAAGRPTRFPSQHGIGPGRGCYKMDQDRWFLSRTIQESLTAGRGPVRRIRGLIHVDLLCHEFASAHERLQQPERLLQAEGKA